MRISNYVKEIAKNSHQLSPSKQESNGHSPRVYTEVNKQIG